MSFRQPLCIVTAVLAVVATAHSAKADFLYWVSAGDIFRISPDGSGSPQLIVDTVANGIAVDAPSGHLYWTGTDTDLVSKVWRSNLDGSSQIVVLDTGGRFGPAGIDLDLVNRQMYFSAANQIIRDDLDPTTPESMQFLPPGGTVSFDVGVDPTGGHVYWTNNSSNGEIQQMNLDGSTEMTLVDNLDAPWALDLDLVNDHIYWTEPGSTAERIARANLDGSDVTTLVTGTAGSDIFGIALDVAGNRMFWSEYTLATDSSTIFTSTLSGNNVQVVTTFDDQATFLAFAPSPASVPEPTSMTLLALAGIGAISVRRLRREP